MKAIVSYSDLVKDNTRNFVRASSKFFNLIGYLIKNALNVRRLDIILLARANDLLSGTRLFSRQQFFA